MTESKAAPGVALLFADADLGAHLREALVALGARIVYEGAAAQVQADSLRESGADVVVVNLEPAEDEHFDRLCAILDEGGQRVVFNDAEASRDLSGWDKARWARHLAAKLLGGDDVDPPRPAEIHQAGTVDAVHESVSHQPDAVAGEASVDEVASVADTAAPFSGQEGTDSELLSAELEAMLADEDDGIEAPGPDAEAGEVSVAPVVRVEQRQAESTLAPATDWELEDIHVAPPAPVEREDASQFGIEKVQAADYLKPEAEEQASPIEPGLKLELVSLEESVAPSMIDKTVSEMVLDDSGDVIRRVVLVAAGPDATAELGEFLAGLPGTLPALVLIVQHQRDQQADAVAAALDTSTRLPVKVIADDALARQGQAWLLPAGHHCRVARNGRLALAECDAGAHGDPSIDQCLDALVDVFGADTTVVVLAGDGRDALAGARKVSGCGGRVWVQDPAGSDAAMAAQIRKEELAASSGSPADLAMHLVEEYA